MCVCVCLPGPQPDVYLYRHKHTKFCEPSTARVETQTTKREGSQTYKVLRISGRADISNSAHYSTSSPRPQSVTSRSHLVAIPSLSSSQTGKFQFLLSTAKSLLYASRVVLSCRFLVRSCVCVRLCFLFLVIDVLLLCLDRRRRQLEEQQQQ